MLLARLVAAAFIVGGLAGGVFFLQAPSLSSGIQTFLFLGIGIAYFLFEKWGRQRGTL